MEIRLTHQTIALFRFYQQGSILGPTLFLIFIFINDLPLSIKHWSADFFAMPALCKTKPEVESKLQSDGTETCAWSRRNKLPINYDKSTIMATGTKQKLKHIETIDIEIDNCKLKNVKSQKFLGRIIHENLNWTSHIDHLCATI